MTMGHARRHAFRILSPSTFTKRGKLEVKRFHVRKTISLPSFDQNHTKILCGQTLSLSVISIVLERALFDLAPPPPFLDASYVPAMVVRGTNDWPL